METATQITEKLAISAGGKLWTGSSARRVYFNLSLQEIGLRVDRYNTGNIASAGLNGESISNTRANEISNVLRETKVWWENGQLRTREASVYGRPMREIKWVHSAAREAVERRIAAARES